MRDYPQHLSRSRERNDKCDKYDSLYRDRSDIMAMTLHFEYKHTASANSS